MRECKYPLHHRHDGKAFSYAIIQGMHHVKVLTYLFIYLGVG
jgi:hypothetical protein